MTKINDNLFSAKMTIGMGANDTETNRMVYSKYESSTSSNQINLGLIKDGQNA